MDKSSRRAVLMMGHRTSRRPEAPTLRGDGAHEPDDLEAPAVADHTATAHQPNWLVESIERRLALSLTLPLEPPHIPSVVAAASPLEVPLVESIQSSGTVRGTFHIADVSSPPLFIFTAKGTLSPDGKSTVTGSISDVLQNASGTITITTRHGKITASLASSEGDAPTESFHYTDRVGTGQFVGTTGEGDLTVTRVLSKGKGAPHGTITIHFLTTNEG